jgi:hypothetical protein
MTNSPIIKGKMTTTTAIAAAAAAASAVVVYERLPFTWQSSWPSNWRSK